MQEIALTSASRRASGRSRWLRFVFARTIAAMDRTFLLAGALAGFLGVGFGAFGAHALRARISPEMLAVFETGVRYQMYHALALVLTSLVASPGAARTSAWLVTIAGW